MQNDTPETPPQTEAPEQPRNDQAPPSAPPQPVVAEQPSTVTAVQTKSRKWRWLLIGTILLVVVVAAYWFGTARTTAPTTTTSTTSTPKTAATNQPLQLDTSKNYGNKYKDGILPVGDGKYSTTSAKQGYVYICSGYARNIQADSGGAGQRGPWFTNNNTEYDTNKKAHVQGAVTWQSSFTNNVSGTTRTISTNDLPSHATGIFPVQPGDPAYQYDKNPNTISAQNLTYALATAPSYSTTPNCMGGQVGIMLTGVALFNGFDAEGRDAGAWEVQDGCDGHPEKQGEYHYHTLSGCIKDVSVKTVIGYALDGYPITGPQVGTNNILTTSDLDECHGITSQVTVDGKTATTYHYVMTQDFPYSVSCFRGAAIQPPGQKALPH